MEELLEKIKKIEALIEGAKTEGEKLAAISDKSRLNKRILDEGKILKKEYVEYSKYLEKLPEEITDNIIKKIHEDEDEEIIPGKLE